MKKDLLVLDDVVGRCSYKSSNAKKFADSRKTEEEGKKLLCVYICFSEPFSHCYFDLIMTVFVGIMTLQENWRFGKSGF